MNFIKFIQTVATGKNVLKFFIPAILVYALMLLYTIPNIEQYTSGMKIFDLLPSGYSYEYTVKLLQNLGVEGIALYLYYQLPLDFLYPSLFAISCSLLLSWIFLKSPKVNPKIFYLCLIPIFAGTFDYFENLSIIYMLTSYPNISEFQVNIASIMTILKSGFTMIFWIILIVWNIVLLKQRFKTWKKNK